MTRASKADKFNVTDAHPSAIAPSDRILAIDILRGLALFGVLMVNLVNEFRVSIFEQFLPSASAGSQTDELLSDFVTYALDMKSFSLFSLLFGTGLAIQFDRLGTTQPLYWLNRRLFVLLGFGLFHLLLVWDGDILTEYALAGLFVLPLVHQDTKLVRFYSLAILGLYVVMPVLFVPAFWPSNKAFASGVAAANQIYRHGDYLEILRFRIDEVKLLIPLHVSIFPRTLGLMLFGAWIWKSGLLQNMRTHSRTAIVFGFAAISIGVGITRAQYSGVFSEHGLLGDVLSRVAAPLQALGYAALIVVAVNQSYIGPLLKVFASLGRMAFTNYILQSLIFGWIFYGYGMGQFGRLSVSSAFLLGAITYLGQVAVSTFWFRWFKFGPLEWLWRSLTYGQRQKMWKTNRKLHEATR